MNRKNFLKNKKINWIKVVIQILSFALIPGLFEGEFAAVGNIVSCIYKGNISWESVKYSVWWQLCRQQYLWEGFSADFSAALGQCRICYGLAHIDCGHYFREKEI